jgi:Spy/CpxP family protein refolding chaperone
MVAAEAAGGICEFCRERRRIHRKSYFQADPALAPALHYSPAASSTKETTMKKTMLILSALSLLGSTAAFAQDNGAPPQQQHQFRHRRHGFGGQRMMAKLGLTQAQQDQVNALKSNLKAEIGPVRQVLQQKRGELKTLWSAPNKDRNAILAKEAEIDQQRGIIRTAMVDFRIAFNNLLSPQQQAQIAQMKANHHRG